MPINLLSAPETFSTGEWITDIAPGSDFEPSAVQYRTAVYSPTDNDAVPVAVCPDLDDIRPAAVAAANAALISAAPELYAAVRAFMSGDNRAWEKGLAALRKATAIDLQPPADLTEARGT